MKKIIISAAGIIGGFIASVYGGWTSSMTTLLIFMTVDFLSGMICAGVFRASDKTDGGGLSSKVGFRGIGKKCMIMLFVLVGARLDITLGVHYIRDAVCVAFIVNELLSIIENAGTMGLPVPKVLSGAIEVLQKRSDGDAADGDSSDEGDDGTDNA